jgi:hypothetical protein
VLVFGAMRVRVMMFSGGRRRSRGVHSEKKLASQY